MIKKRGKRGSGKWQHTHGTRTHTPEIEANNFTPQSPDHNILWHPIPDHPELKYPRQQGRENAAPREIPAWPRSLPYIMGCPPTTTTANKALPAPSSPGELSALKYLWLWQVPHTPHKHKCCASTSPNGISFRLVNPTFRVFRACCSISMLSTHPHPGGRKKKKNKLKELWVQRQPAKSKPQTKNAEKKANKQRPKINLGQTLGTGTGDAL